MADNVNEPVVTVESLQAELGVERDAHQVTKDALEAEQTTHQNTQDALDQALLEKAQATDALAQATTIIEGQKTTIAEQDARINELQVKPAGFPIIEVARVKYEVQAKSFKYQGKSLTVEKLLSDKKLQAELVKLGVGYLVKVEG